MEAQALTSSSPPNWKRGPHSSSATMAQSSQHLNSTAPKFSISFLASLSRVLPSNVQTRTMSKQAKIDQPKFQHQLSIHPHQKLRRNLWGNSTSDRRLNPNRWIHHPSSKLRKNSIVFKRFALIETARYRRITYQIEVERGSDAVARRRRFTGIPPFLVSPASLLVSSERFFFFFFFCIYDWTDDVARELRFSFKNWMVRSMGLRCGGQGDEMEWLKQVLEEKLRKWSSSDKW